MSRHKDGEYTINKYVCFSSSLFSRGSNNAIANPMETGIASSGWQTHPYLYRSSRVFLSFTPFYSAVWCGISAGQKRSIFSSLLLSFSFSSLPIFFPSPPTFLSILPFPLLFLCLCFYFHFLSFVSSLAPTHTPKNREKNLWLPAFTFSLLSFFPPPQSYNVMPIIRKYNSLCLRLLFIIYSSIFFTFLISPVSGRITAGKLTTGLCVTRGEKSIVFTGKFSVVWWGFMIFPE